MSARKHCAHRALPLDVVEARARAARKPWADGDVRTAEPFQAASSSSEFLRDPPRPPPPAYPWRALGTGLLIVFVALGAAHAFGAFSRPSAEVAAR